MTSTDGIRTLVRSYFDAWETGDPDRVAARFADDFSTTYTTPSGRTVTVDSGAVREWIAGWLDVVAEMRHEVHEVVVEGDRAIARVTYTGVHDGELFGVEPTDNRIEVREFVSFRFADGEVVALRWLEDTPALLRQIGVDLPV